MAKDALGTPQERSRGAPGCAKRAQEHSRSAPGTLPRRAQSDPGRSLSAFASLNAVRGSRGSIFDRFGVDAQELQSAFRIGFYSVLSMSDVVHIERSSHAKTSKKQSFRARKSRLGASKKGLDEQVRVAKRPSWAKKRARSARSSQSRADRASQGEPGRSAGRPSSQDRKLDSWSSNFVMDIYIHIYQ